MDKIHQALRLKGRKRSPNRQFCRLPQLSHFPPPRRFPSFLTESSDSRGPMSGCFIPYEFLHLSGFCFFTLCGIPSIVMFCFRFFHKFCFPIGLHSRCSVSPTACGTKKCSRKHHDRVDAPQCRQLPGWINALQMWHSCISVGFITTPRLTQDGLTAKGKTLTIQTNYTREGTTTSSCCFLKRPASRTRTHHTVS